MSGQGSRRARGRAGRVDQFVGYLRRRQLYVAVGLGLGAVAVALGAAGDSFSSPWRDLSLNLSADLVGTILVLFIVGPVFDRSNRQQELVLDRLDHDALLRQMEGSREVVAILELWTDLLDPQYLPRFRIALDLALDNGAEVQILLLDPHTRAAEQRGEELGRTDVPQSIMQNLVLLHQMRDRLDKGRQERFGVRIYSALPSAQVYRVDDHILASFFPARVPSWESPQHQTRPQNGLGRFLTEQFSELWDGVQTRTLAQFRSMKLEEDGADLPPGQVRSVRYQETIYIGERQWMQQRHHDHGFGGVRFNVVYENVRGDEERRGPFRLEPLNDRAPEYRAVYDLFHLKYGERFLSTVYQLVEVAAQER